MEVARRDERLSRRHHVAVRRLLHSNPAKVVQPVRESGGEYRRDVLDYNDSRAILGHFGENLPDRFGPSGGRPYSYHRPSVRRTDHRGNAGFFRNGLLGRHSPNPG